MLNWRKLLFLVYKQTTLLKEKPFPGNWPQQSWWLTLELDNLCACVSEMSDLHSVSPSPDFL